MTYLVKESDFRFTPETRWALTGVVTYLEDGWTAQEEWTTLAEHCILTKGELGQALNQLVGGTRYDKAHADAMNVLWTCAGEWPRRSDLGAFMFYVSVTQRVARIPPANPGGMLVNPGFSE